MYVVMLSTGRVLVCGTTNARLSVRVDVQSGVLSFMWWSLWCILFAMVAASVGHFISPHAQGSGIPELKSILSGTPTLSQCVACYLPPVAYCILHVACCRLTWTLSVTARVCSYLSFPVLLAKVVGVVSALGGGLAIGKEVCGWSCCQRFAPSCGPDRVLRGWPGSVCACRVHPCPQDVEAALVLACSSCWPRHP